MTVALLLYQFLFFNVFLPGHTRGSITLDGKHVPDRVCCCCESQSARGSKPENDQVPSKHDKEECAICHFAARVLPTPVVNFVLPELGLLEILPPSRPSTAVPADLIHVYQSRGPPPLI